MENASKAILIASAVIVVITIVGIGVNFFYKGKFLTNIFGNNISETKINEHNSQFLMYNGNVTGQQIIDLVLKAASNNRINPNMQVEVVIGNRELIAYYQNETDDIIYYLSGNSAPYYDKRNMVFNSEIKYNEKGYIDEIDINGGELYWENIVSAES